jgi:Kef-type K+ transport system membrane component KefB
MITLKNEGLALSRAAIGIMTSAVLDDIAALCLVAIMVPIATGDAEASVAGITWILGKALIFFFCVATLNGVLLPHGLVTMPIIKHVPILRSCGVHHLLRSHGGEQAVLITLVIGLGTGLIAKAFGFHPAIGAYMAGLVLEEGYFDLVSFEDLPDDATESEILNIYNHVKDIVDNAAFCWLGPVFFLHLGAQIEMSVDIMNSVVVESLTIFVILFFGQVVSAGLAARYVPGGYTWTESLMIGFGTLGRAELFFVVLRICYIDNPIFSTEMFYSLTFAAMLLNISALITVSLYKPYYSGDKRCCVSCGSASSDGDSGPLAMTQLTWLHRKAMKSHRELARRVYHVDTDLNLEASVEATGVRHRIHCINKGLKPCSSLDDEMKHNVSIESPVQQESHAKRIPKPVYPIVGCGVKGCNRSTCVVCNHINTLVAEASSRENLKRLAYEDEREDLAAMDHGRPTFENEFQRTVSEPEHQVSSRCLDIVLDMQPHKETSSATLSGATGHELAREVRKYLETHDQDVIVHTKGGVSAHGRSTSKERPMQDDASCKSPSCGQKLIMSI